MTKRRGFLASTVGVVVALSGCAATGGELEFSSNPAAFADDAVDEAGYEQVSQEPVVEERQVEAGGTERDVTVTNHLTQYERSVSVGDQERPLAFALTFTTPSISFAGQEYNPVSDWGPTEIVENTEDTIEDRIDGEVRDVSEAGERSATVLGTETNVTVLDVTATVDGTNVQFRVPVTKVRHEGDFVLVATMYPERLASEERSRAETLLRNVEHEE
jgi:hypothetical protein